MTDPQHVQDLLKPKWMPLAQHIALRAHADQTDIATGAPYWKHLERVAGRVTGDKGKAVAWLHDILEDTTVTVHELTGFGFPTGIIDAVMELTRFTDSQSYESYIHDIAESTRPLAIHVKLADLIDHLHPNCPEHLKPRYYAALPIISQAALDWPLVD